MVEAKITNIPLLGLSCKLVADTWLQVSRLDGKDGISWDDLQSAKNIVLGEEVAAMEIYPPQSEIINTRNVRHLWKIPEKFDYPNLKKIIIHP